jgi:RimJ/RimL family protein N-acetyltransferase
MATQIAELLNKANRLVKVHSMQTILSSHSIYFVEICENKVVGCVGLTKINPYHSIAHHASVTPAYRQRGVGKKLLKLAIQHCDTTMLYGRVREDNIPSLKMSFSLGFKFIRKEHKQGYNLILIGRTGGV